MLSKCMYWCEKWLDYGMKIAGNGSYQLRLSETVLDPVQHVAFLILKMEVKESTLYQIKMIAYELVWVFHNDRRIINLKFQENGLLKNYF